MYKAPFALRQLGLCDEANEALDWIKSHAMVAPGEFRQGKEPPELARAETYRSSWILSAARLLRRNDIASDQAIDSFLSFQDPTTGGFFGGRGPREAGILNVNHTAMGGLACLVMDREEEAKKAGQCLLDHLDMQPSLGERFLLNRHTDAELVCNYRADERVTNEVNLVDKEQLYYCVGGPIVLFCRLTELTGDVCYLDGARTLCGFVQSLPASYAASPFSGKIAWGCAYLALTGNEGPPRQIVKRISEEFFLPRQGSDGLWPALPVPFGRGYVEPSLAISSEYVREIGDILRCLPERARSPHRQSTR
jgi:hypothetical protein